MKPGLFGAALSAIALLSACGGGGSGSSSRPDPVAGTPTPAPAPSPITTAGCSLSARAEWVGSQMREWYLFPDTLPASLSPSGFSNIDDYVDALTATARSQRRDRFFTYVTSIREENAFYQSGQTAGFGIRLAGGTGNTLTIAEAFEGAPALAAGIDRGTVIVGIGTNGQDVRAIDAIRQADGEAGVNAALGPSTVGTTRVFRIRNTDGTTRDVSVTKANYEIEPVSPRYGVRVLEDGGKRVGYVNLRTFITEAGPQLRSAFASFKSQGITEVIVDLRYNGGGLVSIADLMGDLLGGNRATSDVFSYTTFRASKAAENESRNFRPQAESIAPTKVAFIGTRGSASASELVINAFVPYLNNNMALVGTNTFGKPVGQIALDRSACDDRLRVVAFRTENASRQGDYYDGLATTVPTTCQAGDDVNAPLGSASEASIRASLDFLAGRQCTRIAEGAITTQSARASRELLTPERPSAAQREVPGLF